jgi:hypothetical protein
MMMVAVLASFAGAVTFVVLAVVGQPLFAVGALPGLMLTYINYDLWRWTREYERTRHDSKRG